MSGHAGPVAQMYWPPYPRIRSSSGCAGGQGRVSFTPGQTRLVAACPSTKSGVTLIEMLIVVMIIGVIAGVSLPALTAGLASVRLSSASGSAASFLTSAMNRVERRELSAAIVITPKENRMAVYTAASGDKPDTTLQMPRGVAIEGDEPRRFLLQPGGTFPRITLVLRNEKGARRSVRIDPATGVPDIKRVDGDGK